MLAPILVTAPASSPVSLDEAKRHLAVDHAEDDALITSLIGAAVAHLDGWSGVLGRAIVTQTWRQSFPAFATELRLRVGPIESITSVTYLDGNRATQTAATSLYRLLADNLSAIVRLDEASTWPSTYKQPDAVTVTWVAGVPAASVPLPIRQAILMLAAHWYQNRETVNVGNIVSTMPFAVSALIAPYRRVGV